MSNYEQSDPYGTYDAKGELSPYSILNQMKSWNKEIRLTVSNVQVNLDDTIQKQSQIILDLDSIELSVLNIDTRVGSAEATIAIQAGQIALKAEQSVVDGINTRLTSAEVNIDGINANILLKADASVTDGLNTRLGSAELEIDGLNSAILLKADSAITDGLNTRLGSAELEIDGLNSEIILKATSASVTTLTNRVTATEGDISGLTADLTQTITRVGTAEVDIDGLNSSILLKADSTTVTTLTGRVTTAEFDIDALGTDVSSITTRVSSAEVDIDGLQGEIVLKANTSVTDGLGTRVSSAEQNISSLNGSISSKVSYTDYNGVTIASLITQDAMAFSIDASKINLLGITNVAQQLWIGTAGSSEEKALNFRDSASIFSPNNSGEFHIQNLGGVTYLYNDVRFYSPSGGTTNVNFSNTNVIGLVPTFG